MDQFDPDAKVSWIRVRPSGNAAAAQFLTALIPVATAQWSGRTPVNRLDEGDVGAGAVVSPGSALEERWIFARAGAPGKTAGDLSLLGSQVGMAARDASGTPVRAVLFGQGSISDQGGARLLLATQSAAAIEAKLTGGTLAVSGNPVHDFQAYAPGASSVTLNGVAVDATLESGMGHVSGATPRGGRGNAGCRYARRRHSGRGNVRCRYARRRNARCRNARCRNAGCRGRRRRPLRQLRAAG
jgi:hypothetical protein